MSNAPFQFTKTDLLAALAFECQRVVSASGQHAAGLTAFPDPEAMGAVLRRAQDINNLLIAYSAAYTASGPSLTASEFN
jgi:hypothetical protein